MGIRSLISVGLLLIPIAITVGVLVGLDRYHAATGGPGLFVDNSQRTEIYCQKSTGIQPKSRGEEYTLNPNQWNWQTGDPGALCLHVTVNGNGSYASETAAPPFWVTWNYPRGPASNPVHAFPNIKLDTPGVFPAKLESIKNVNVDLQWHYGLGDVPVTTTDIGAVTAAPAAANVAIDMFLDSDAGKAQDATQAAYEVMVWLAYIEPSVAQPIGLAQGSLATVSSSGTTFNLYYGQNAQKQNVLTWYPATIVEKFTDNLKPFIDALQQVDTTRAKVPTSSDYLGYIGMGSEAYFALQNVTFSVPQFSMQVIKS